MVQAFKAGLRGEPGMSASEMRWRLALLLVLVAGGSLWVGWKRWDVYRNRRTMEEIEEEMENGLHATAAQKLISVLDRQPDSDQALYLLGTCEMERGRMQSAAEAWTRVAPGSQFAPRAIMAMMQIEKKRGRFTAAEKIIKDALNDPRIDRSTLPILLGPMWCLEGRLDETLRLIESRWQALCQDGAGASESAISLVREHINLRRSAIPIEAVRSVLDQSGQMAPDDDRIWLGKANLAIRVGSLDEATRWIDACLRRRPEDVPVWRARLDWAVASNRVTLAREALNHLPAELSTPAQIHRLAAWFAAQRGDGAAERQALERLVVADPADIIALDRLALLAEQNGQPEPAALHRRRKTEIDSLSARYQQLHARYQPSRDAVEMAHLAEQLGQWFEAKAFLTLAIDNDSDRDDLRRDLDRLKGLANVIAGPGRTLADLLASETRNNETNP
jgi:thioredoxin-like negative regulator of GroEL